MDVWVRKGRNDKQRVKVTGRQQMDVRGKAKQGGVAEWRL